MNKNTNNEESLLISVKGFPLFLTVHFLVLASLSKQKKKMKLLDCLALFVINKNFLF